MKIDKKLVALLATGVVAISANAALVVSSTSDAEAQVDGNVGALNNQTILAGNYYTNLGVVPVFAFQLPTLAAGESFGTATLTLELASVVGAPTFNGDVVGIRSAAADTVLGADFAAAGTMLHNDFLTPASATGVSTSSDFSTWLNTQNDGEFVFIKVDAEGWSGPAGFTGYNVASANNGGLTLPTMEYTVIPEPATLGLVGVFGGGILFIRRKLMM